MSLEETCYELREILGNAVQRNKADGLLLSGGLDTSILATLSRMKAFTVVLGSHAPDLRYSQKIAKMLSLEHKIINLTVESALQEIPTVIKILKTFDPSLPNDLAIYFALRSAKENGIRSVMTGDGADELFAGYQYMWRLENSELDRYIRGISQTMWFSANALAEHFGLRISQPYLDEKLIEFTIELDPKLKVRNHNHRRYGKWILRRAFKNYLPKEIVWRRKDPIEYGSGTNKIRRIIESKVPTQQFNEKKQRYKIEFMSKEHLFYYEIYRKVVGEIPQPDIGERPCPTCGAGISGHHCRICGICHYS